MTKERRGPGDSWWVKFIDYAGIPALAISVAGVALTAFLAWQQSRNEQALNTFNLATRFSDQHIVDASFSLLDLEQNAPTSFLELRAGMQKVSPLLQHLKAFAACIDADLCEDAMALTFVCDRMLVFETTVAAAYRSAKVEQLPEEPFYRRTLRRCRDEKQ